MSLLDAYHLQSKVSHKYESDKYCNEILASINVEIKDAISQRQSQIVFKLPSQFTVGKLDNKKSKTLIHGKVIKALLDKHYDIKYKDLKYDSPEVLSGENSEGARIKISWKDMFEDKEIDEMEDLIKRNS